ncbi:MAG: zinc transport system ATP-binding protein [Oceanicoccus sp.]
MNKLISVEKLQIKKAGVLILEDISFDISKGDYIGLVGPNGAGKTTLLHALIGLEPLTHGEVHASKVRLGYVPQHFAVENFNLPLTVSELVRTGLKNPREKKAQERMKNALEQVGMGRFIDRNLQELSGGERQKVLLARALVDEPELLLLDEPMSALDDPSRLKFYELLRELNEKGLTIFLVSHDLEMVVKHVGRVLCINRKLNHACHTVDMTAEKLKEVFECDRFIHHHDHA